MNDQGSSKVFSAFEGKVITLQGTEENSETVNVHLTAAHWREVKKDAASANRLAMDVDGLRLRMSSIEHDVWQLKDRVELLIQLWQK